MEERTERYWIRLQTNTLDLGAADEFLRTEEAGAVNLFLGTTRRWTGGRETTTLEYETYQRMALTEMRRLAESAAARWPIAKVCLWHREGDVPLREVSVLVGVSTPHRADAFEACRHLIDALKERVPIWKRERFADGTTEWVEGNLPPTTRQEERLT